MPDIKFPELRFPEIKLPEGLRDMNREDIQKAVSDAMSDVKLPDVKLPKRSDIAKSVENALPTRSGPSPVPFALLAMLGGLIVGWILATSPMTAPRINAAMAGARQKIDEWRSTTDLDELDGEPEAFRESFRSPAGAGSVGSDGVGVGPGKNKGASVAAEGVSSESF